MQPVSHILHHHTFWLSPQRCLYWEQEQTLVVSDLHFGKTGHFRKHGIAVPQQIFKEDLQRLVEQISFFTPRHLVVVGDFFHSENNKELDLFLKWRHDLAWLPITLVEGNHDILAEEWYQQATITVTEHLQMGRFGFVHDITALKEAPADSYFFSGHIHPGIIIKGLGRQALRLPCFYFGQQYAVLPAFSRFTGMASIQTQKQDAVYAISTTHSAKRQPDRVVKIM